LKRNGFPASPANYRRAPGPKTGRPSDSRKSGRCVCAGSPSRRQRVRAAPAAAPSPPECARGARPRDGHGGPHGPRPRVPCGACEASSLDRVPIYGGHHVDQINNVKQVVLQGDVGRVPVRVELE